MSSDVEGAEYAVAVGAAMLAVAALFAAFSLRGNKTAQSSSAAAS